MSPSNVQLTSAVVLHGPKDLRLEQRPLWPPASGEVQVAIMATGLCGSDLHYYMHGRNGDFALRSPLVLGHESGGIITAIGSNVPASLNLKVGDRVAIEPGAACGRSHQHHAGSAHSDDDEEATLASGGSSDEGDGCSFCESGRYNLCEGMRFCSSAKTFPHLDGTLQTKMNHPAHLLHPLPDTCTYEQAALAEPLSVVLHATRRTQLNPYKHRVLVIGAGAVGFLACALAKALGVAHVAAIDIDGAKLIALEDAHFADATYCIPLGPRGGTKEEGLARSKAAAIEAARHLDSGKGYDVVFECTGVESCIQMAIHLARTGGKVALVGMGSPNPTIPLSNAALREVDLVGIFRYANTWPEALKLLGSKGMIGVEKMITQRFRLDETAEAFDLIAKGKGKDGAMVLKVMVGPAY